MKKYIYTLLLLVPMVLASCNDDDVIIETAPGARGTVVDDMGNTYGYVRIGNLEWTTSNALNGPSMVDFECYDTYGYLDYFFYDDDDVDYVENEYMPKFGNLMTYEDAVASAPDGWRLPTDEDWKALERALGVTDADNEGWRGNDVAFRLMDAGGVEMAMTLGGILRCYRVGLSELYNYSFDNVDECGYYWTATKATSTSDQETAYFRKLVYGQGGVERRAILTNALMSVRWCRNATND